MEDEIKDAPIEDTPDEDIQDSFLKGDDKDMHRISSALGRALKQMGDFSKSKKEQEDFNNQVLQTLQTIQEKFSSNPNQNTDISRLNEDLQTQILSGNPIQAFDTYMNLKTEAERSISQKNASAVNSLVANLKEEPFFADLEGPVRNTAMQYVQNGKDPETAVNLAYFKHKGDFLAGIVTNVHKTNPNALKVATGSGETPKDDGNKGKLPPEFKKRAEKDIQEGLFKDEQDWINNLAPSIRKQLGV